MTARCDREPELLDVLASGRWPEACGSELRDHVAGCLECRDLLLVAEALVADRRHAEAEADVPSSGAVWWRMQMRREREAREAATKTVGRVHGIVVAATVVLLAAVLRMTSIVDHAWGWFSSAMPGAEDVVSLSSSVPLTILALAGVTILVFAPVALYLALARD
jgi:hypothetical protein